MVQNIFYPSKLQEIHQKSNKKKLCANALCVFFYECNLKYHTYFP